MKGAKEDVNQKVKTYCVASYDEDFKAGAVRTVAEQGQPHYEIAIKLEIYSDTLRNYLKNAGAPLPGQADRQSHDAKRLRELEMRIRT